MIKAFCVGVTLAMATMAHAAEPFRFEAETSLDDMTTLVRGRFSEPSTRDQVRAVFVGEGGATLIAHPRRANVEKYLYDINLCSYYVWRWNISADYTSGGKLKQIYVNGAPALHGARLAGLPKKGPYYALMRPRPEAFKGEYSLAAIVADRDGDLNTTDDMDILTGVGPMRADPLNMGSAVNNPGEVWRSIFDLDDAKSIAAYAGDCSAVDAAVEKMRGSGQP
ncbi:hypothetical protein [Phenylobacterium sp.]|uniref:hypothetical protein n=1 Tax=Phenylobacterium sp. TaxID=1871053 RepID=UPI002FC9C82C